jgi:uncharacterized membrane protein
MNLSEEQKNSVVEAIKKAEKQTSGELKIHIEKSNPAASVEERTMEVFHILNMQATNERNGVLIYIASENRQFAIYGDEGINQKVKADFWESTKSIIQAHFKAGQFSEGLIAGITNAGEQLAKYFPYQRGDVNELSDDISFG